MAASYGAISITTTAVLVFADNSARKSCIITNNGASTVFFGMDSSVTAANGMPVLTNGSLNLTGQMDAWRGAIWGITSSGTADCRTWQWEA